MTRRPLWSIRRFSPGDSDAVATLLRSEGLPTGDLGFGRLSGFVVATDDTGLLGVAGIERAGSAGLLRSVAVEARARGRGLGAELVREAERAAAEAGAEALYLLTTTAPDFFAELGYERIPRDKAPAEVAASAEFARLCPSSAVCMRKRLTPPRPDEQPGPLVDGLGGAFIFAADPARLAGWYAEHLGIAFEGSEEFGAYYCRYLAADPQDPARVLDTTFSIIRARFPTARPVPEPEPEDMYGDQPFMVNLRVRDIDAVTERLEAAGVRVIRRMDESFGRFAWVRDADGNRVELYQPGLPAGEAAG